MTTRAYKIDWKAMHQKHADEIKAIRIEMGERLASRMKNDDRDSGTQVAIGVMAIGELMSSLLAASIPDQDDRMRMYPMIIAMIASDVESLCASHDDPVH